MGRRRNTGWENLENRVERGPWHAFFWGVGMLAVMGLLCGGGLLVTGLITNPFVQATRIINKTIDADNVIYNYEWFKLRHEGITAVDVKIRDADAAVKQFATDMMIEVQAAER